MPWFEKHWDGWPPCTKLFATQKQKSSYEEANNTLLFLQLGDLKSHQTIWSFLAHKLASSSRLEEDQQHPSKLSWSLFNRSHTQKQKQFKSMVFWGGQLISLTSVVQVENWFQNLKHTFNHWWNPSLILQESPKKPKKISSKT